MDRSCWKKFPPLKRPSRRDEIMRPSVQLSDTRRAGDGGLSRHALGGSVDYNRTRQRSTATGGRSRCMMMAFARAFARMVSSGARPRRWPSARPINEVMRARLLGVMEALGTAAARPEGTGQRCSGSAGMVRLMRTDCYGSGRPWLVCSRGTVGLIALLAAARPSFCGRVLASARRAPGTSTRPRDGCRAAALP